MKLAPSLRSLLRHIEATPLHPQWHVFRHRSGTMSDVARVARGRVLDIGCADRKPSQLLPASTDYIALDYPTTAAWYGSRPHVYGDAQRLPFRDGSIATVLLLDVLEHLRRPEQCLTEIHRTLAEGGVLLLQVPFLYPIHDAPRDYQRWTQHGLHELARRHGFDVMEETPLGQPAETAALLLSVAASKHALEWLSRRSPLMVLIPLLPLLVLGANLAGWLFAALSRRESFMASGYRLVLRRTAETQGIQSVARSKEKT